jgi:hypothetical protein
VRLAGKRTGWAVIAGVLVAAAAVAYPIWTTSKHATRAIAGVSSPQLAAPSPTPVLPASKASAVAQDTWGTVPQGPLAPRVDPAAVWTGSQLLVWGGASAPGAAKPAVFADGAAYDPATHVWTPLPAAPIKARASMGYVWTDDEFMVFGGYDGASTAFADGAAYSPSRHSWRLLPGVALQARVDPQVLWTGSLVIVIGGRPVDESATGGGDPLDAAAYDPATNRWHTLPPMPPTPGHDIRHLRAVDTTAGIYVWQQWQNVSVAGSGQSQGESLDAGMDVVVYHPQTDAWTSDPTASTANGQAPQGVGQLVSTGDVVYAVPGQPWKGDASTWPPSVSLGPIESYDVVRHTWASLPAGPYDDADPVCVWTGAALLQYDARIQSAVGGGPSTGPGSTAVFDPATSTWTVLPTAPKSPVLGGDTAVWTGTELLAWGTEGLRLGP